MAHSARTLFVAVALLTAPLWAQPRVMARWPGAHVYRKTGTWHQYRHDSALVDRPGARYAVAALCGTWRCEQEVLAFGRAADGCAGAGQ